MKIFLGYLTFKLLRLVKKMFKLSLNLFSPKGFPIDQYKSSGVRQSKIYKCPVGTYGSERVD